MNTVLFVNATIGFSENLFLIIVAFLQYTTTPYSSESVCVCVLQSFCVSLCEFVFWHDNSKSN